MFFYNIANYNLYFKEILTSDGKKLKEYYPVLRTMIICTQHGIGIYKMIELFVAILGINIADIVHQNEPQADVNLNIVNNNQQQEL